MKRFIYKYRWLLCFAFLMVGASAVQILNRIFLGEGKIYLLICWSSFFVWFASFVPIIFHWLIPWMEENTVKTFLKKKGYKVTHLSDGVTHIQSPLD